MRSAPIAAPLALILMLGAAPALATEYGCDGVFNKDTTLADLEAHFGKENVVTGEVPGPEGTTMIATTIYPDDPEGKMEVRWWDEETSTYFAGVSLAVADTGPGGVHVNMGIEEVERINGAPFELLGFGWDYGGGAWFATGALSELPGGCVLGMRFHTTVEELSDDEYLAISGDQVIRSDDAIVRKAKPEAWEVSLSYPAPQVLIDKWDAEAGGE